MNATDTGRPDTGRADTGRRAGFDSGHPTAHWPDIGDDVFHNSPLYRDSRGYVWQRGRNGHWRSSDGLDAGPGLSPPDGRWAPYLRIIEVGR